MGGESPARAAASVGGRPAIGQETGGESDAYQLLRSRLTTAAAQLTERANALNARRLEAFGDNELVLAGSCRIRTREACVPRDIVAVGGRLLLGRDVDRERSADVVEDVFSLHTVPHDGAIAIEPVAGDSVPGLLDDPRFRQDLAELFRYYRQARLLKLRLLHGKLLAVFRTGPAVTDVRVLRWQVASDASVTYLDARGERDHVVPPAHEVEWITTTRDDHVLGRHPHVTIHDEVFVGTVGGSLAIKTRNDTETAEGIYSEPVDEPLQSLADADIAYAYVGPLILLRIRPYNEETRRYLVFNTRSQEVLRLDRIGQACLRLPDDQGIVFPGGYYLSTGVVKTFDAAVEDLEFERVIRSPNGEDALYVFHARAGGRSLLLPYNVISKEISAPLTCRGYALLDDGTLVVLRAPADEPAHVHRMQVWRSPYVSDTHAAEQKAEGSPLERIGNADLVRAVSDCLSVTRMVDEMTPAAAVYEAIRETCERTADLHHWLGEPDVGDLRAPLLEVRNAARQILDEHDAIATLRTQASDALGEAAVRITALVRRTRGESLVTTEGWMRQLSELRREQGHLESLRELRYADTVRIDQLAAGLRNDLTAAAQQALSFLARPHAFEAHRANVDRLATDAENIATAAAAGPIGEELDEQAAGLQTVVDAVTALEHADATVRTSVLERLGQVLADINRARATLLARGRELTAREERAAFAAESALLGQAVTAALAAAVTPDACDEQLARLLLRFENLEARFGAHTDFADELGDRRSRAHEAFSVRQQSLRDEQARRTDRLADSANRMLDSIRRRITTLGSLDEINTHFASDPVVARTRRVAEELHELGDAVRAEELAGRLKAARQEAARALRDRLDLYADGGSTIRLGAHRFAVTTQRAELTLVHHDDGMAFALTGTDYRAPVTDPRFETTRDCWHRTLASEAPDVYRAEYLAATLLAHAEAGTDGLTLDTLHDAAADGSLTDLVRRAAESRLDEGYERGVHDHDASAILDALLRLHTEAGVLRYPSAARAAAQLFWAYGADDTSRSAWSARAVSLARARTVFGPAPAVEDLCRELERSVAAFLEALGQPFREPRPAGRYLFEELARLPFAFATSATARELVEKFHSAADSSGLAEGLVALPEDPATLPARLQLAEAWLGAFATASGEQPADGDLAEAVALEVCGGLPRRDGTGVPATTVDGLLGEHPRIDGRSLHVRLDEFLARTDAFHTVRVPAFRAYQSLRSELTTREHRHLKLDDYRQAPLTTFVRNRLIDEVYLPLIGDNFARQIGVAGEAKRTDNAGLLLLVSPPGYGKTTLVEYVADRLGMLLVKVDGPALGNAVTSLDPEEAPNATARREVERINFALAAGNNTLLYLDDIQHTSPELLQKFLPLCDAQRRIEGVLHGEPRTHDLRGKRFAVIMSGNPYTESGQLFHVPDMLANRADVRNLGDVIGGREDVFALSFVENALTANPVLAPLAARNRSDLELLIRRARGDASVTADRLSYAYAVEELDRIIVVLTRLLHARQTVLTVNRAYIASAAQAESSRTEPPFRLQGSYRSMNRIAERIVPVMNEAEIEVLLDDHYRGEAQALGAEAEANLLKLAELRGRLTSDQADRWAEVKAAYVRGLSGAGGAGARAGEH